MGIYRLSSTTFRKVKKSTLRRFIRLSNRGKDAKATKAEEKASFTMAVFMVRKVYRASRFAILEKSVEVERILLQNRGHPDQPFYMTRLRGFIYDMPNTTYSEVLELLDAVRFKFRKV